MSTQLEDAPAPVLSDGDGDDPRDMHHWVCNCSPDIALCGKDVTGKPFVEIEEAECVVCEDLVDQPCERCGG